MIVVKDERTENIVSTCEHCGQVAPGRHEEVIDAFGSERGSYFLCLECLRPRLFWKTNEHSQMFATPVPVKEKKTARGVAR